MSIAKQTALKTSTSRTHANGPAKSTANRGVLSLLSKDHKEVDKLFKAYQKLTKANAPALTRHAAGEQICTLLTVHATVEEELFYPALRASTDESETQSELDEAQVEHASIKDLVRQLQGMEATDALYDAKVKVLGEYVTHHVQEEEHEMFPKARGSDMDLVAVGRQVKARKEELMGSTLH